MYSKARVAGHPIHPMLVTFPLAFYTTTVVTLLVYIGTREAFWYRFAMVASVAGIVTAVIATIPGAIDLMALPRGSRSRRAGLQHAGFNLAATALFAVTALVLYETWIHRTMINGEYIFDATIPLAIAVVAWVTTVIAGSLGWTLVQTHHVGIKPARIHADRPSREPELDVPVLREVREIREAPTAVLDDLATRRARRSAARAAY
ncbi:MAG TPA: DUF2231 domain-containing protein [Kofleriaceae bacterium]|jgi:uncharacterized membrane protein|nr:DUF2231 domain-containing protein [Kofleriaceae bacterium]